MIKKSEGVTRTERLLAQLCERSFLKLWSYPNPRKDDGNELCDVLAVFENRVFVFFDRESRHLDKFKENPELSWERWKRAVVDRQIKTARGAERYIRSGRPIYLDAAKKVPFPLTIPQDGLIVHKIAVAHGATEACKAFSDKNVYGSLAVSYGPPETPSRLPFMIHLDRENPVHVLDSHNLPIVLEELDTIFDLSAYLEAKAEAIGKYEMLVYAGEEDLLAHYFSSFDEKANRHFIGTTDKGVNGLLVSEGEWKEFRASHRYIHKKQEDRPSYLWDDLIQRTCQNSIDGTLLGDADLYRGPSAVLEMAKEPRFMRRESCKTMLAAIDSFPDTPGIQRNVSLMPSFYQGKAYVFLQLKFDGPKDDGYRGKRQALLEIACGAAKNRFNELQTIVGIGIDAPKFATENSEDFLLMDCSTWPEDRKQHYEERNKDLQFFRSPSMKRIVKSVREFPDNKSVPLRSGPGKIGRNEKCPCGSGKKFKKCHGKA